MATSFISSIPAAEQAANKNPLFRGRLSSVRPLVNMLKTINFRPKARCTISSAGLVFTVEESQSIVAQAHMRAPLFTSYEYDVNRAIRSNHGQVERLIPEDGISQNPNEITQVLISLENLIECLTLFYGPSGSNTQSGHSHGTKQALSSLLSSNASNELRGATTAILAFDGHGSDFEIMLEERGTISQCWLSTSVPEPSIDLMFQNSPVTQQFIIRSEWLRDAFSEMDPTSETVWIAISSTEPHFCISTVGENGSTEMTYPNSERVLDSFYCNVPRQEHQYKLSLILKCRQALAIAEKIKIRVNQRGFLSFQFMIPTASDVSFANFVFAPLVSTEDVVTNNALL